MSHDTVKLGHLSARLWQGRDGRWKWHSHEAGRRVLRSAKDLHKARQRAKEGLAALRAAKEELTSIGASDLSEFLEWKATRSSAHSVLDAVAKYLAHLAQRKVMDTRMIKADLERFAAAFPGRITDVTVDGLNGYLAGLGVGARRHNNIRATIVALFRWARLRDMLPDGTTVAEKTHPLPLSKAPVVIYTPAEFHQMLQLVPKKWRLGIAIGGLAGLRTEEIAGLRWEDIKLGRKLIEVRAEICKTGRRRLVPIVPALAKVIRSSEACPGNMVVPRERLDNAIKHIRRLGGVWKKNALRHSFGSYRCAMVKSAGQVALEMGNSEAVVRAHYLEIQDQKAAKKWFDSGSIFLKKPV